MKAIETSGLSKRYGSARGTEDVTLSVEVGRGEEFMALAPRLEVETEVTSYPLERANEALGDLRAGRFRGAAVLTIRPG